MSVPTATFDVYFLRSEWSKNRSDLEGFNSDTFSNATRRVTMSTAFMYEQSTNKKIGEITFSWSLISNLVSPFITVISNDSCNIYDKLILPNISTGFIIKSSKSYLDNLDFIPPRIITQDIYGHKVVILSESKKEELKLGEFKYKIEVYKEDF